MKRAQNGRVSKNGNGKAARRGNGAFEAIPFLVADVLSSISEKGLIDLYRFWEGGTSGEPESPDDVLDLVRAWMVDPAVIEERISTLGRRLGAVVEDLIASPKYQKSWEDLAAARSLSYLSDYDLEACVAALARNGLVVESVRSGSRRSTKSPKSNGSVDPKTRIIGVPIEVGDGLRERRREKMRGVFGTFTLRGHLDQLYSDPSRTSRMTPSRLRELYKMYSQETASASRIERLPDGVRGLVEKAILEFGGVLPRHMFQRMETNLPHWNGRRWSMILEQSLIGTVCDVDLSKYGIDLRDETLIVFNEVSLAWLRRVAVPGDPDRPHEELSLGIDLVSNISRFLAYIDENGVRFTVRGEIFKTTEKKILQHLIPNPGRELTRDAVLRFIFRFSKRGGLIDRTGKRTFRMTTEARAWSSLPLAQKQRALLDFMLEEPSVDGGLFHQMRMRNNFMRMLKRLEPGVWYDLMYLPFLARNNYLSTLDDLRVEDQVLERAQAGRFHSLEDVQRLAWNLVTWVRQRLYLLGLIDMGYDASGRPVAMRLTQHGARLLGLDRIGPVRPRRQGSLVVTPDFEVVLFPTGDDVELIHDLDRFCDREKLESILHFRICQEGVRRALRDAMPLKDIQGLLEAHSRTPVPQNVTFSIQDWAFGAGLMRLSSRLVLACPDTETMKRFQQDAGTRRYISRVIDGQSVRLKGKVTPKRMQSLLRDLGYLVDLDDSAA